MSENMSATQEFVKFYNLLMESAPENYSPHLFVLEKSNKVPHTARGAWSKDKNRVTAKQAVKLMHRKFNIGIGGMNDHLIILDIDNEDAIDPDTIVPTLSVRSRSRTGAHYFYYIDDIKDKRNIALPDVGELRAQHQYVVCSGSYVPTNSKGLSEDQQTLAGYYTVENAVPPTHITFNDLPAVFRRHYICNYLLPLTKYKMAIMSKLFDPPAPDNATTRSKSALFDLDVKDVVHVPADGQHFASPLHGSKNGKNCVYADGWLICYRCGCSHNAMTLLAVMAGIATCSSAGYGHRFSCSGGTSIDMRDGETCYKVWDYARRTGILPADDAPPRTALNWFVTEVGICREDEIVDGWKLPRYAYEEGRRLLQANI